MRLNSFLLVISVFISSSLGAHSFIPSWGPTGHRTIGKIADQYLKKRVRCKIEKILNGQSLAKVSTYADDIKSDRSFSKYYSWHYVNFPDNSSYQDSPKNEKGDVVMGIQTCIRKLKDATTSNTDQEFYLKMLVHFVGDMHQPLHVGHAEDKGGNTIQVRWFDDGTNIHRVWDSDMIEHYNMTYTELADNADQLNKGQVKAIQQGNIIDWVHESKELSKVVYASASSGDKLGYRYMYDHFNLLRSQLQKGGIRLAKILNDIYG